MDGPNPALNPHLKFSFDKECEGQNVSNIFLDFLLGLVEINSLISNFPISAPIKSC